MPNINTLIKDIHAFLHSDRADGSGWFNDEVAKTYSTEVTGRLREAFGPKEFGPRLRLSQMGPKCPRQLWYSIHSPQLAEPLSASAVVKFTYGHLLEALVISWAKAAGHEVTGEQDELDVDGIKGHRDCVIDGCIVDVKSTSTLSFRKFKDGTLPQMDDFGYLDQLDGYIVGSRNDPLVRVKDRGYILAVDKQLGHMCLYEHRLREDSIRSRIRNFKEIIILREPPRCECGTIHEDNGNVRLSTPASYSSFKHLCFPHLRTFLYSKGPVFFSKVMKVPSYKGIPLLELDNRSRLAYAE